MIADYGNGVCAVPGCGKTVPAGNLMCRPHWFSVPQGLRAKVWSMLRRYEREQVSLAELRAAQEEAIGAVK